MVIKISGGWIVSGKRIVPNPGIFFENGLLCKGPGYDGELNAAGLYITPGFIDIHTHGALLKSFHDGAEESFDVISRYQASHGVTSVVGALSSMPLPEIIRCCEFMRRFSKTKRECSGARILGLHCEGPFLSLANRGAHRADFIKPPEKSLYEPLLPYADVIRILTVAPDNDDAVAMIREFASAGVVVSGGHDDSSEPFIMKAVEAGMTHTTHIFCVMSVTRRLDGKKYLGLTECGLEDDRLTVELIADGHHVTERMLRLAYKAKGTDRVCLVSDMIEVGGLEAGDAVYETRTPGSKEPATVVVDNGVAKLPDRSLNAGSITSIDAMVKNAVNWGVPFAHAVEMVTGVPAKIIREYDRLGSLDVGKLADMTFLDPGFNVVRTIIDGKTVYAK